jgi:DNA-binding MarR family transcriptional regulator
MLATARTGPAMTAVRRYDDALADLELSGPALSIYLYLFHDVLSPVHFRPLKLSGVVAHFQLDRSRRNGYRLRTVESAIRTLLDRGYIERERGGTGSVVRRYRLIYDRMP